MQSIKLWGGSVCVRTLSKSYIGVFVAAVSGNRLTVGRMTTSLAYIVYLLDEFAARMNLYDFIVIA